MDVTEGRRIQTILVSAPINHPRINGLLGIEQDKSPEKECTQSHRFSLELFLPDDKSFPEFDYQTLLKEMGGGAASDNSRLSTVDEPDDTVRLKALAQKFEEKYGSSNPYGGKKKQYKDEFVDAGYGYDDSDTFIDNSEAYDEVVPSDWTTEHGGFYINQGNLDYKPLPNAGETIKKEQSAYKKKKKKKLLDTKKLKTPGELSTQKKKKQLLNKEKQRKRQESLQKAQKILVKKSKKTPLIVDDSSQDIPLAKLSSSFEDNLPLAKIAKSSEDNIPLAQIAKSTCSSQKVTLLDDIKSCVTVSTSSMDKPTCSTVCSSNTITVSSPSHNIQTDANPNAHSSPIPSDAPPISTKDVTTSDVTKDGTTNGVNKDGAPGSTEERKTLKVESALPLGLSEELSDDIKKLKVFAAVYVKGKGFFTVEVNKVMLSFARACRKLSPKIRNAIYDHMLFYLPCARDTLVKRCRRLIVQHQRDMEDEPIRMLKQAIDDSMLKQKKNYENELAEALQEQAREQIKQTGVDPMKSEDVKEESINEEEKKAIDEAKKNFPKKKYMWSEEIRVLLCDVVKVRVGLYKMSKSRSMTAEEYIKDFLESEIRKLWPKGWMTSRILYKECRTAHQEITQQKGKKWCSGLMNVTVPNILKSGPKTPINTSASSPSTSTASPTVSSLPATTHAMCNGIVNSLQKPSQPTTFKTVVGKPVIKTIISGKANVKLPLTNHTTNPTATVMPTKLATAADDSVTKLLTITTTSAMSCSNIIVSNSSAYTLPKSTTVVTWNNASLISSPSTSPHKLSIYKKSSPLNTPSTTTRIPATVKIVTHVKAKMSPQINPCFLDASKTILVKTEPGSDTEVKQSPLKVDSILSSSEGSRRIHDYPEKCFISPPSTSATPTCSYKRANVVYPRTTTAKVSPYAMSPTFIHNHNTNSLHSDTMKSMHSDTIKSMHSNTMNTLHNNTLKTSHSDAMKSMHSDTKSMHSDTMKTFHSDTKTLHSDTMKTLHSDTMKTLHSDTMRTLHSDTMSNDIYFRQGKRKLSVEINDNRSVTPKRNSSNSSLHNHSSVTLKSIEGKSWSEIESDLVRLSQEAPPRKENASPVSATVTGKSPDRIMQGKEWCSYSGSPQSPRVTLIHISQGSTGSPVARCSADVISKPVGRSASMARSVEAPFDNDICRKSIQVMTSKDLIPSQPTSIQNNYVLSNKQLSPLTYQQQSGVLASYTKSIVQPVARKTSQLSVKSSCKNTMEQNMMEYTLPQHPSARQRQLSISKSDHQYSTSFDNTSRLITEQHGVVPQQSLHATITKHDVHSNNDQTSPLRHSQHINQSQPVHGIHMQGKFIGLQGIAAHQNHPRLSMEEQLKAHHKDARVIRSEQDYQAKFGTYAPRFS